MKKEPPYTYIITITKLAITCAKSQHDIKFLFTATALRKKTYICYVINETQMKTVIYNIGSLAGILPQGTLKLEGAQMNNVECINDAYLIIEDGIITEFGPSENSPAKDASDTEYIDANGGFVMPCFCDSHTHIVYAGCRDGEFRDKIAGLSYEEIAARGGGILNSADLLHETSEDELYEQAMVRVHEIMAMGTGAVEIKSGYGLTVEDELKMLRVIRRIKETAPITVKANFLGAHAVGRAYKGRQAEYVDLVCNEMLPRVAEEGLADFVDVFCDAGFFTVEETDKILAAAAKYGITPKIHANELEVSGGVQVGVKHNALSVDHLEKTTDAEIEALRGSRTMPTMLPGCSFFLGIPYGNAKGYIEAGLPVALASDYNPGSSPSGNMRFVMALGCIRMRLTPEQSFNACTINTAYAMGVSDILGSITVGKKANLIITKPVPSLAFIPYSHQTPVIEKVIIS